MNLRLLGLPGSATWVVFQDVFSSSCSQLSAAQLFTGCLSLWNRTADKCLTHGAVLFVVQRGVISQFAVPCSAQPVEQLTLIGWK